MNIEEADQNFDTALRIRLDAEYQRGLEHGLRVAKKIRSWLTRQPDSDWQKQVRDWADKEINNAEKQDNIKTIPDMKRENQDLRQQMVGLRREIQHQKNRVEAYSLNLQKPK